MKAAGSSAVRAWRAAPASAWASASGTSSPRERRAGSLDPSHPGPLDQLRTLRALGHAARKIVEIVSKLTARTNGALEITDGTLYPVLYRLERAGFVTVRWETPGRGVPRKYYDLTETGRAEQDACGLLRLCAERHHTGVELARLTREWTMFAKAMTDLLRSEEEPT